MARNNLDSHNNQDTRPGEDKQVSPSSERKTRKSFVGIREKLIIIFLIVKIIPLVLLAVIAWHSLITLGNILRETSVTDSREALTAMAVQNIERMSTAAAQKVAEFLYRQDSDIIFLSEALKHFDFTKKEHLDEIEGFFKDYTEHRVGLIRQRKNWKVAENGMSWVQTDPYVPPVEKEKRSHNIENEDTIDGASFRYRPPYGFGDSRKNLLSVPLYDEVAVLDKNGQQIAKYVTPNTTKKRHTFPKELVNVSDPKNTFAKSERYFEELKKLGTTAADIYVSDVIGPYVKSHFIGMYTPDNLASKLIEAKIAELDKSPENAETVWRLRVLNSELKDEGARFNSEAAYNAKIRAEINRRLGKGKTWTIRNKNFEQVADELKKDFGFDELSGAVRGIRQHWKPEEEGYAGAENPLGIRFEGIVRWAKAIVDIQSGEIKGYITFALNHEHLLDMIAHITPMEQRYSELSSAWDGNYAFIWDYQCRSIVHPRHYSICGFNGELGIPETPWLETTIYDGMVKAGYKREDWQRYIATLKDYEPWTGDTQSLAYQSRTKKPAGALTKEGLVGLDGRYLNNAPQCTGWMDLTRDGGSGSLYIFWSGVYKSNTAAAIPYYTGQYSVEARGNRRGFGFVSIGCGIDDFSIPADRMGDRLTEMVRENLKQTQTQLIVTTTILSALVIFIAIWMASYLSGQLKWLIDGISRFRAGYRQFRFATTRNDEFGKLADSFDDMAANIVTSVHTPFVITDMNYKIIYANERCTALMKESFEDISGRSYLECSIYPPHSVYCPITVLQKRGGEKAKVFYDERVGRYFQGEANYFVDENGKRIGYIITSHDVTDISLQQIELEKAKANAEQANEHKSKFLAKMSHELRTPMNAILGMNALTQNKITSISDRSAYIELSQYLRQLEESSNHLLNMLNDILDISNLETGSIQLHNEPVNLKTMLDDISGVLHLKCTGKRLELETRFDNIEPAHFLTDGLRLRQVLNNLFSNAVKYTAEGGKIEFTVERKDRRNGKMLLMFSVADTGVGISRENFAKMFAPFEQVDELNFGSTGLGLAISQHIIRLFGSEIVAQSEVGKGSTFCFSIWLKEDSRHSNTTISDATGLFTGQKALVIDDVPINRMVLVALLRQAGFTTVEAKDGKEGVEKFAESRENEFNVVFMDIQMPVMNGYESTRSIRNLERSDAVKVPIIAISANTFEEDIKRSLESGMNSHYAKPIRMDTMSEILMTYLVPTPKDANNDSGSAD